MLTTEHQYLTLLLIIQYCIHFTELLTHSDVAIFIVYLHNFTLKIIFLDQLQSHNNKLKIYLLSEIVNFCSLSGFYTSRHRPMPLLLPWMPTLHLASSLPFLWM